MTDIILFGAGACGRAALKNMLSRGEAPIAFADNDESKWGKSVEGVPILSPSSAARLHPRAKFIVTIYNGRAREVRQQLREMNVYTAALNLVLPIHREFPKLHEAIKLSSIVTEGLTLEEIADQIVFRCGLNFDAQLPPSDIADLYFPDFISKNPDEIFVDCGANDGDTIRQFLKTRTAKKIIAFEPDPANYAKLKESTDCVAHNAAVGLNGDYINFSLNGDTSSCADQEATTVVPCVMLDELDDAPTFIKMDIEGAELAALDGARLVIQTHKPVLAICAYHRAADFWEIPFLIHGIVPDYDLRLRRYAEGPWEMVWYAIPPGRLA